MIIELECITVSETCSLSKCYAARTFSALAIAVFDCHDLIRKVALVHIKVETIHGDELNEGNVVCLLVLVCDVISEHEATSLAGMCMEINEHFKAFVLLSLLHNCFASSPNGRMISFRWI